jgi:nucleoside-diphosphate-sugar epimerase
MIVAITGITGLLGRNLAFELLQRYQHKLDSLTILALGRSSKTNSLPSA